MSRASRAFLLIAALSCAACAEPPNKEMNQAQGAIDAARAAGADQYAATEFTAAVDALRRSEEAAAARDYRLALNHAIDSRERAQNAAKEAASARSRARGDAERVIAEINTLLTQLRDRLREPEAARLPRRTLTAARDQVSATQKALQEARTAVNNENYAAALKAVEGANARLQATLSAIEQATEAPSGRRRR